MIALTTQGWWIVGAWSFVVLVAACIGVSVWWAAAESLPFRLRVECWWGHDYSEAGVCRRCGAK